MPAALVIPAPKAYINVKLCCPQKARSWICGVDFGPGIVWVLDVGIILGWKQCVIKLSFCVCPLFTVKNQRVQSRLILWFVRIQHGIIRQDHGTILLVCSHRDSWGLSEENSWISGIRTAAKALPRDQERKFGIEDDLIPCHKQCREGLVGFRFVSISEFLGSGGVWLKRGAGNLTQHWKLTRFYGWWYMAFGGVICLVCSVNE